MIIATILISLFIMAAFIVLPLMVGVALKSENEWMGRIACSLYVMLASGASLLMALKLLESR